MAEAPVRFGDGEACVEAILSKVGQNIVLDLPVGLGKANSIANALYERAEQDPKVQIQMLTVLTLGRIEGHSKLERRLLEPLMDRLAGNYPELKYDQAIEAGRPAPNIAVYGFFLPAGRMLNASIAQQNYISVNYTHALHALLDHGVNVIALLVARRDGPDGERLSLSCNPDLTLDLIPELLLAALRQAIGPAPSAEEVQCLKRVRLNKAHSLRDWLLRWFVVWGLRA
jgi:hypothetical protein